MGKRIFRQVPRVAPLSRIPVVGAWYHRRFSQGDEGNVIPLNRAVEGSQSVVLPSEIVKQAVEVASYRCILDRCLCRLAEECKAYPVDLGCIFLGEGARSISPRLGRSASVGEAQDHLEKCRAAGLVHLMGHYKFDAILLDARPSDRLLSICNCCPCCCIFRVFPDVYGPIGDTLKRLDGVEVRVSDDCSGCGACLDACFLHAISLGNGKATIGEACRGCGRCVAVCPRHAIHLFVENPTLPAHFLPRIT